MVFVVDSQPAVSNPVDVRCTGRPGKRQFAVLYSSIQACWFYK